MAELDGLLKIRHTVKKLDKGSYLFQEGDAVEALYIIREGKVQIGKVTPEGRELSLKICATNQLIGEIRIFSEPANYRLDARALEDSSCYRIALSDLEDELLKNSGLAIAFMKWMGIDQQKTQTKFRDLLLHGKKGALYSTLIRLTNSYGVEREDGILIDMVLTNQELANFGGMTREVVNRLLAELKRNGTISLHQGKIVVHQLQLLKDVIHCEECPVYLCRID
ncbi:MAG TPA: Crp/Fnr family transcriptional regulator [Planococcus sp. (in: firmicutes)]|nr:Crp/Fnr family transcriptional regulator [Planococcus sp. (in: firmicutes)]